MPDSFLESIILLLLCGMVFIGMYFMSKHQCYKTAKVLGYQCSYQYMVGCVIHKPDGSKVLLKQMRQFNE